MCLIITIDERIDLADISLWEFNDEKILIPAAFSSLIYNRQWLCFLKMEKKGERMNGAKLQRAVWKCARDQYLLSWEQNTTVFHCGEFDAQQCGLYNHNLFGAVSTDARGRPSYNAFDLVAHTWSIDRRWKQNSASYEPNRFVKRLFPFADESLSVTT